MASPVDLLQNIRGFSIIGAASKVLEELEPTMADLNVAQLAAGKRADGSMTTPLYKESTIAIKTGKPGLSGVTDRVTLFDTGAFHAGVYADVQDNGIIEFGSTDLKARKLEDKYSDKRASKLGSGNKNIFGLNEDSKEQLKADSLPRWQDEVTKATGLEFS